MSRKGNCWDNAGAESFFHTLKTECVYLETFDTREQAQDVIFEFLRDETRALDDRAFWSKIQDVVRGAFDEVMFARQVERWQAAAGEPLSGDPMQVVEVSAKKLGLNDAERGGVLRHLIAGGRLSRYGLANAVTRMSQEVADYDRATELERLGAQVIELPRQSWQALAAGH